jgi:hypothetical protein
MGQPYHDSSGRCTLAVFQGRTVLSTPTIPDIRTTRLLAHRMQPQPSEILLNFVERCTSRYGRLEVGRETRARAYKDQAVSCPFVNNATYVFVFPSTTRSETLSDMKSSREGPSVNVSVKLGLFKVDGLEAAGVARERAFLDTEMRATRECLRIVDIVDSRTVARVTWVDQGRSARPARYSSPNHEYAVSTRRGNTFENDEGSCPQGM